MLNRVARRLAFTVLIVIGILTSYHLRWRRQSSDSYDDEEASTYQTGMLNGQLLPNSLGEKLGYISYAQHRKLSNGIVETVSRFLLVGLTGVSKGATCLSLLRYPIFYTEYERQAPCLRLDREGREDLDESSR